MAFHRPGPGAASGSVSGYYSPNSRFGDTTLTKIFVGGLAWETKSETLHQYFEPFGDILEAVVITDKNTGRSKGYGFVTFYEPESARMACLDPSPVIDGRRANCNLAAYGRPRPFLPLVRPRLAGTYFEGLPVPRGAYVASSLNQQSVPFSYQQGLQYSPASYTPYGPEYVYQQTPYSPYMGQQYFQVYGVPGSVNTAIYPYGQFGQPVAGGHGYVTVQGYTTPGHHAVQISGPNVNGTISATQPAILTPYPTGKMVLALEAGYVSPVQTQSQFVGTAQSPKLTQGSGSEQTTQQAE